MAPENASRNAAFRKAKEDAGIPRSQQITHMTRTHINKQGKIEEGPRYQFGGKKPPDGKPNEKDDPKAKYIRDDAAGHKYEDPSQNRGRHFNIEGSGVGDKNHYDYN